MFSLREKTNLKEIEKERGFFFKIISVVAFRWNIISFTITICIAGKIKRADLILPENE